MLRAPQVNEAPNAKAGAPSTALLSHVNSSPNLCLPRPRVSSRPLSVELVAQLTPFREDVLAREEALVPEQFLACGHDRFLLRT